MLTRSNAGYPAARALVGDYAVQQNASNRAYPVINSAMDTSFGPAHAMWRALWNQQQVTESQVTALCASRDKAHNAAIDAVRGVYRSLQASQGANAPTLKQYVPGGSLELINLPPSKLLAQLAPYAPVIESASDATIPSDIRATFAAAYAELQAQQTWLDAARQLVTETQRNRAAQDDTWDAAYRSYHRAVEYEMEGDRQKIQMFIKIWPPTSTTGSASAGTGSPTTGTATGTTPATETALAAKAARNAKKQAAEEAAAAKKAKKAAQAASSAKVEPGSGNPGNSPAAGGTSAGAAAPGAGGGVTGAATSVVPAPASATVPPPAVPSIGSGADKASAGQTPSPVSPGAAPSSGTAPVAAAQVAASPERAMPSPAVASASPVASGITSTPEARPVSLEAAMARNDASAATVSPAAVPGVTA